jgi:WD40 repeat protein
LDEGLKLNDIGISNDGAIIAAVGGNDRGYLLVAGANNSQIRWEQHIDDCNELNKVVISPDGQTVYASEPGRRVYVFDISTKKIVKRLEIEKYKTPENNPQTITCITLSCDGRLLAAVSSPISKVWIWGAKTGEKVAIMKTGQFATSSIVFSLDSSLLAAADYTLNPINVWRISDK